MFEHDASDSATAPTPDYSTGPFAPELNQMLGESFGQSLQGLDVQRGEGAAAHALDAHAYTIGTTIGLGDRIREDPRDAHSMETIAHEVSHALGARAGGAATGKLVDDGRGDHGEVGAYAAGAAFRNYATGDRRGPAPRLAPTPGSAVIHRSEAGEHANAVTNAVANARAGGKQVDPKVAKLIEQKITLANGVQLTQGEISALMGDFYGKYTKRDGKETFDALGSFTALNTADPEEMQALLGHIRHEEGDVDKALAGKGKFESTSNGIFEKLTSHRKDGLTFMELAQKNSSHFSGKDETSQNTNMGAYAALHQAAMQKAAAIAAMPDGPKKEAARQEALALEASSQHFMVDRFSAGHQFDKDQMVKQGHDDLVPTLPHVKTGVGIVDSIANGVVDGVDGLGNMWGNVKARVMHNRLNRGDTADGKGVSEDTAGFALGDSHWADPRNRNTRKAAGAATVDSYAALEAAMSGRPASTAAPANLPKFDEARNAKVQDTARKLTVGEIAEAEVGELGEMAPVYAQKAVDGGLGMVSTLGHGLSSLFGGTTSKWLAPLRHAGPLASLAQGGLEMLAAHGDMQDAGVNGGNVTDFATGALHAGSGAAAGLATTLGTGAVATAASGAAGVLGAGATGLQVGKAINNFTEQDSKGRFGRAADGHERTAQEAAIDDGLADEQWLRAHGVGAGLANAGGAISSMGRGVANVGINAYKNFEQSGSLVRDAKYLGNEASAWVGDKAHAAMAAFGHLFQ